MAVRFIFMYQGYKILELLQNFVENCCNKVEVIFYSSKLAALLEIECPFESESENIEATVNNQLKKCLVKIASRLHR